MRLSDSGVGYMRRGKKVQDPTSQVWTCENVPLTSPTSFVTNTSNSFLHTKWVPNDHPAKVSYFVQIWGKKLVFLGNLGVFL